MSNIFVPGAGLIFMKVGIHAQETLEDIIERKKREYEQTGMIFWGYGGNTCHPTSIVQPFAKGFAENGKKIHLVMHEMNSKHNEVPQRAEEYSIDGISWIPVPDDIHVRGSRFALVLGELEEEDFELSLTDLTVNVGPSRGRNGVDYIRGQSDKGCFEWNPKDELATDDKQIKHIGLKAELKDPYSVFLR